MIYKEIKIEMPGGLKSRDAANFVQVAGRYKSQLLIEFGNKKVNAKSMIGVLHLGLKMGDVICVMASGEDRRSSSEFFKQITKRRCRIMICL